MKGTLGQECAHVEIGADGSITEGFEQVSEVSDQWNALADRLAVMWSGWIDLVEIGDGETIHNALLLNIAMY